MKKCVLFLINGLGIEKPGSYSISIDQTMPQLAKVKETSYFQTAITSSLEYRGAYQRFFLGDTYRSELSYIQDSVLNDNVISNPTFQGLQASISSRPESKLHVFVEPTNDKVIEQVNNLVNRLTLSENQKVYLHLILPQQTNAEYDKLIDMITYIKFHLGHNMTLGFVMGKEYLPDNLGKVELDYIKKTFFFCSAERWTETDKKLRILKDANIRPCVVQGFCANNDCYISNGDNIMFFNTRRANYDNFIRGLLQMAPEAFKAEANIPMFSMIKLHTEYNIPSFIENIEYDHSLANILLKYNKKCVILTDNQNMSLVNFYANGLNSVNNPIISFMLKDDNLYNPGYIQQLIDTTPYDLFIFDYHMDISSTVNHLKEQLSNIDRIIGNLADVCVNKHSLFVTSLYGLKTELPVADYNDEKVVIDYEMQIPIFFFDYSYPRSKYYLAPGETNDILSSALKCIIEENNDLYTLIKEKGLINNLLKAFK